MMTQHQELARAALLASIEALNCGDPDSTLEYMTVAAVALTDPSMKPGRAVLHVTADAAEAMRTMDIDATIERQESRR